MRTTKDKDDLNAYFKMYVIILLFCVIGNIRADDDSNEARYIDLLPEEEKKQFIESIARRIIDDVDSKNEATAQSVEISEDQLNQHSEYVSKLLKEEQENLRRRNSEKFIETSPRDLLSSEDDSLKQKLEKDISSNENIKKDNIDQSLEKGKIEKMVKIKRDVTTEEITSTSESTTEITSTVLVESTQTETESTSTVLANTERTPTETKNISSLLVESTTTETEKKPKDISIEISIEDETLESTNNVSTTSKTTVKQVADLNKPELQTIPVEIVYNSDIDENVAKYINKNATNSTLTESSISQNVSFALKDSNVETKGIILRENGLPETATVIKNYSPEVTDDSIEEIQPTKTTTLEPIKFVSKITEANIAARTTTPTEGEDWVFTAAIFESLPIARENNNTESSIAKQTAETTTGANAITDISIKNETAPAKDDPVNSTQVAKPESDTRRIMKIMNNTDDLPITEETTVDSKKVIIESTTIAAVDPKSSAENPETTENVETADNVETTEHTANTDNVDTTEFIAITDDVETTVDTATKDNVETTELIATTDDIETTEYKTTTDNVMTTEHNETTENSKTSEKSVLTSTNNGPLVTLSTTIEPTSPENTIIKVFKNDDNKGKEVEENVFILGGSGLNRSQTSEKPKHNNLSEVMYETQIEDSKLFNKLKSKYDKEYFIYEIAPGKLVLDKVRSLEKERRANRITFKESNSLIDIRKKIFKILRSSDTKNVDESPHYIPIHNYGSENAYFNPNNRFDFNPDDSRAVDESADVILDLDVRNGDADSPSKDLRSPKEVNNETPYAIPVHNYAPENAYFNPHNRFELSEDTADLRQGPDVNIKVNLDEEDLAPKKSPSKLALNKSTTTDEKYFVPIHNYASENAYFNPHNRFEASPDSRGDESKESDVIFDLREGAQKSGQQSMYNQWKERIKKPGPKTQPSKEYQYVPVYNYAPKNAYYNPHNIYGLNSDDRPGKNNDYDIDINTDVDNAKSIDQSTEFRYRSTMTQSDEERAKDNPDKRQKGHIERIRSKNQKTQTDRPFEFRQKHSMIKPPDYFDTDYFYGRRNNDDDKLWLDSDLEESRRKTRRDKLHMIESDDPEHPFNSRPRKILKDPTSFARKVIYKQSRFGFYTRLTTRANIDDYDEGTSKTTPFESRKGYQRYLLRSHKDAPDKLLKKRLNNPGTKPTPKPEGENKLLNILKILRENTTMADLLQREDIRIILNMSKPHDALVILSRLEEITKSSDKNISDISDEDTDRYLRARINNLKLWQMLNKLPPKGLFGPPKKSKIIPFKPKQPKKNHINPKLSDILSKLIPLNPKLVPKPPKMVPKKPKQMPIPPKMVPKKPKLLPIPPKVMPKKSNVKHSSYISKSIQQKSVMKNPKASINLPMNLKVSENIMLQKKRTEKDSKELEVYVTVLRDMIQNDDKALKQFDWLGSAVDVRSAVAKLIKLIDDIRKGDRVHPSDLQLLKYLLYLHNAAKNVFENNSWRQKLSALLNPSHDQRNLKDELMNTKNIGDRSWLMKSIKTADDEFKRQLESFNDFLDDLQVALNDLHDAIKHIALVTTFKNQKWYENLKGLYLKGASKVHILELMTHLVTTRLVGLVENSVVNGLDDDYIKYIEENDVEVERTKQEFLLVLKLLNELKNS